MFLLLAAAGASEAAILGLTQATELHMCCNLFTDRASPRGELRGVQQAVKAAPGQQREELVLLLMRSLQAAAAILTPGSTEGDTTDTDDQAGDQAPIVEVPLLLLINASAALISPALQLSHMLQGHEHTRAAMQTLCVKAVQRLPVACPAGIEEGMLFAGWQAVTVLLLRTLDAACNRQAPLSSEQSVARVAAGWAGLRALPSLAAAVTVLHGTASAHAKAPAANVTGAVLSAFQVARHASTATSAHQVAVLLSAADASLRLLPASQQLRQEVSQAEMAAGQQGVPAEPSQQAYAIFVATKMNV